MNETSRNEIFISYRRDGGVDYARMIYLELKGRGYNTFFDFNSLRSGRFNDGIFNAIDECRYFVLVLSENALARCMNEDDWVRREIEYALSKGKEIVPVCPSGCTRGFPAEMPESFEPLRCLQVSRLDMDDLFDKSFDKIVEDRFDDEFRKGRSPSRTDSGVTNKSFVKVAFGIGTVILVSACIVSAVIVMRGLSTREVADPKAENPGRTSSVSRKADEGEGKKGGDVCREGQAFKITARGMGLSMLWCPAGKFEMGSPAQEVGHNLTEIQRTVTLSRGFWLGETEVTQGQWRKLMDGETVVDLANSSIPQGRPYMRLNPEKRSFHQRTQWGAIPPEDVAELHGDEDDEVPVYNVTWHRAMEFCQRLTTIERNAGRLPDDYEFRLPTSAEWEYACRAGCPATLPNGAELKILGSCNAPALDDIAWYAGNSSVGFTGKGYDTSKWEEKQYPGGTAFARAVKGKKPNNWGFYDMLGNVSEWVYDWFPQSEAEFSAGDVTDPKGPKRGREKIVRGGNWFARAFLCRPAGNGPMSPDQALPVFGFRIALAPML